MGTGYIPAEGNPAIDNPDHPGGSNNTLTCFMLQKLGTSGCGGLPCATLLSLNYYGEKESCCGNCTLSSNTRLGIITGLHLLNLNLLLLSCMFISHRIVSPTLKNTFIYWDMSRIELCYENYENCKFAKVPRKPYKMSEEPNENKFYVNYENYENCKNSQRSQRDPTRITKPSNIH